MPQWSTDESSPSCPGDDEWMKAVGGGLDLGASQRSWCWHQGPEHWDNTEEPSIVRRIGWSSNQGLHCTSGRWGQTVYGSERWNKPTGNSSVQVSCSVIFNSLWPHGLQHARPSCPSPTPWVRSNSCPLHQWCHPTISSSVVPFSSRFHLSQHHGLFHWVISSHQVAKVLEFQLQHQSFQWVFRTYFF